FFGYWGHRSSNVCARAPCGIPSLIKDTTDVRLRNQAAALALSPAHAAGGSGETVETPTDHGIRVPGGAVLPEHRCTYTGYLDRPRRKQSVQQRGELEQRRAERRTVGRDSHLLRRDDGHQCHD